MQNKKLFLAWLPFAAITTILSLTFYTLDQQNLRLSANDPQIQLSQDIANAFVQGQDPQQLQASSPVDMATSLAPFVIVYDDQGKLIVSTAKLNGQDPSVPSGVLDYARKHADDRFTWQPQKAIRMAVVAVHYGGKNPGFVLVGRSLKETEKREDQAMLLTALGWGLSMIASLLLVYWIQPKPAAMPDAGHQTDQDKINPA